MLVRVFENGKPHSFLLDAGWSEIGVLRNLKELQIDVNEIETIILSHGHMDHFGCLKNILKVKSFPTPVIVHPDVFLKKRFLMLANGETIKFPAVKENSLQKSGAQIIQNRVPYLLTSDLVLVTGEIERITSFEKGIINAYVVREERIERDLIMDDQALIVYLKGKGLVIITGCAHSGIINTVRYAQKITGINSVHAVIGGFHLSGPAFEPCIGSTLAELKQINPSLVCPMHCTGRTATTAIAREMPDKFVLSSVGSTLLL